MTTSFSRRGRFVQGWVRAATVVGGVMFLTAGAAVASDDDPKTLTGKEALAHPAAKAVLAAAERLAAGKLDEVRRQSVKEVREEWAALGATERQEESDRARERAPDPRTFAGEIEREGILTLYGESGTLRVESAEGEVRAMAFFSLEEGKWKVTSGPMTFAPAPVETAPPIEGAAILEHEIGRLALEYAKRLEAGRMDAVAELLSGPARAARAAASAAERKESDAYRRTTTPSAKALAAQIRGGGTLYFFGEKAQLSVVASETVKNPDGSITSTSSSTSIGFELDEGAWRIAP